MNKNVEEVTHLLGLCLINGLLGLLFEIMLTVIRPPKLCNLTTSCRPKKKGYVTLRFRVVSTTVLERALSCSDEKWHCRDGMSVTESRQPINRTQNQVGWHERNRKVIMHTILPGFVFD